MSTKGDASSKGYWYLLLSCYNSTKATFINLQTWPSSVLLCAYSPCDYAAHPNQNRGQWAQSAGEIANKHIFLCGSIGMTEAFTRRFKALGVPSNQIHYEEFNFR